MTATTQLELPVRMPSPAVTAEDVEAVVAALEKLKDLNLEEAKGWTTAEQIAAETKLNDRKVRKVAAAAMPQIVSYPGSPGYRLFHDCTIEEINHCIESFESQARDMLKRAQLYRQAYYRRFRG